MRWHAALRDQLRADKRRLDFGESSLPDLNGFDFNGDVPTDASLKAEPLTALY